MKYLSIKIIYFSLLMLLAGANANAQQKTLVRGTVFSASDNLPLPGAAVIEMNKDNRIINSTITNIDGNFSIYVVSVNNKLVISFIGHKKSEVTIGNNTNVKIILEEDVTKIEEVTITAKSRQNIGSLSIDERDISMSISKLSAIEIADLQVASVDDALQGKMAGVDIVANTGDPGSGTAIRIRGITSINGNNQPMIIVDGIPLETEIGSDFDLSTATEEDFSQLLNIAPTDIKDISVLKDAAATAVWGSKAANGVLQITTKRGTVSPPKITFRTTMTYKPEPKSLPTLSGDEYSTLILEEHLNAGTVLDPLRYPQFAYDPSNPVYYYNYSQNTDWVKAVTQNGFIQDYNLSVRGGSQKVLYSFSAGYYDDIGNTIETGFNRINTRLNLDYMVSDKLRFSANIAYTHSNAQKNYVPNDSREKYDVRSHAYIKMPNQSIYYYNEYGEETPVYFTPINNPQGSYPNIFNPVAMARDGRFDILSETILPQLTLSYQPNSTWRYTFDVSMQTLNEKRKKFLPVSATGLNWSDSRTNEASDSDNETFTIQTFNRLYFTPKFKDEYKHRLIGLIGLNTYDRQSYSYYAKTTNLANPLLQDPSIDSRVYPSGDPRSGSGQQRTMASYINLNYTFLDRYIIYGNINLNGDSRFGANHRFGLFPAISVRYRISEESFMKRFNKWLDDFSIRASYGKSGSAPDRDYLFYNLYNTYGWGYMGESATYPSSLELSELRWENSYQQNYGINFVAFNRKLNIEADYYFRATKDQYMKSVTIPSSSGFKSMPKNEGTVENRGVELSVNYEVLRNNNWYINLAFNVARNENIITEISEYTTLYSGNWDARGTYLSRVELNQPIGSFYGYLYDGVYLNEEQTIARDKNGQYIYSVNDLGETVPVYMQFGYPSIQYQFQQGDARYVDVNHDGNINYQDIVWLGDYNPLFTGGITPNIKWKQLSLNMVFFFRYGNDVINMTRMNLEKMYGYEQQSKTVLRRWRNPYDNPEEAPSDLLPRALYNSGYNWMASDRFIEDGSFMRWKSLTFRYNFTRELLTKFNLKELYIYTTINNLNVWTNYTGQDPEVSIGGSNPGKDYSSAPIPKTFTLGVNVSF
ncbi:MAG: SusC/RagA family TonB-linked outer membrane protein [Bacteroidales bacterium]|nr:SusC/RagA family TonB-linked outer membrane protein [Bacteroidales bacterium]